METVPGPVAVAREVPVIIISNQEWRRWCHLIQQFSYCLPLINDFARTRSSVHTRSEILESLTLTNVWKCH